MEHPINKYSRLEGLDLARGIAVIGMVFVNFMYVLSLDHLILIEKNPVGVLSYSVLDVSIMGIVMMGFAGRSVSVFLVLFGIGLMLQARRHQSDLKGSWKIPLIKRYLLLILIGFLLMPVWEADILHYIGIFGLVSLLFTNLKSKWLILIIGAILLIAELLRSIFDYSNGWLPEAVGSVYQELWSFKGQFKQIFFNGYHPIFPWLSFVLYGMILGRLDLKDKITLKKMIAAGLASAFLGFVAQASGVPAEFFPADTLLVLIGMANATWIIALCLLLFSNNKSPKRFQLIRNIGRLALSHYVTHVLVGIVPVMIITRDQANVSFILSSVLALQYLIITGIVGSIWLSHSAQGPLERLMRRASKSGFSFKREKINDSI